MSTAALQYQMERLDRIINRRVGEEEAALKRADADLEVARRAKMRQAAEQRREIQAVYADAFAAFDTEVPAPVDDEPVAMYRARLFNRLVRRLPQNHEWSSTRADDIPAGPAMDNIEAMVIAAALLEGQRPSQENLPPSGELISRNRVDSATGERSVTWHGRESFIRGLTQPGRRVASILDKDRNVIWGRPLAKQPTFVW
jgi:hypothetical protein